MIVNVKDFNVDEMMEKIRQEHIRVNGEPDLLEINIYLSKKDMQCETEDKTYATKTFYKEE